MSDALTLPAAGTWAIDTAHTIVSFSARHLMAAKVRGTFKAFSGSIEVGETPETSSVNVTFEAGSIDTTLLDTYGPRIQGLNDRIETALSEYKLELN